MYHLPSQEFQALHAAQQEAFHLHDGATMHALALSDHLSPAGRRASEARLAALKAALDVASAALRAYMDEQRAFDTAAYEAQQRTTSHLQAA